MTCSKINACFFLFHLVCLQLVSCQVAREMTAEDNNCSIPFIHNSKVSSEKSSSVICQNQEFYEDYLYSNNYSVSCSNSNGSDLSWHFCVNENCTSFKKSLSNDVVHCSPAGNLSVLDCYCLTYNTEQGLAETGNCIYNLYRHNGGDLSDPVYHILPKNASKMNEIMCGNIFNRNGTLCGKCKDGYFPQVFIQFDLCQVSSW